MTTYQLPITDAISHLRIDLADTDPATERWSDDALIRAIDKAVLRYSWVNPLMAAEQQLITPTIQVYAAPIDNFYIDRIEGPIGRYPPQYLPFKQRNSPLLMTPAAAATGVTSVAGGALSAGLYTWAYTFTCPGGGETPPSPVITATIAAARTATIAGLATGPIGASGRNIYRSLPAGSALFLAGSIADVSSTTFVDTTPDSGLGAAAPTANTTSSIDQFVFPQNPTSLAFFQDPTNTMEITYAQRHRIDGTGTTIPERHWYVIYALALAEAMWAYLPTVNDNFEYADGQLRDRIDETKAAIAWQTQCQMARTEAEKLLTRLREEGNTQIETRVTWGDIPRSWTVL